MPYIGSLITLATLAFEPFSQQLLSFAEIETQQLEAHSSVKRSLVYDHQLEGFVGGTITMYRDTTLRSAVMNSLFDKATAPPFTCPGQRCDFPSFHSLGVCSSCQEVTSEVVARFVGKPRENQELWNFTTPNYSSVTGLSWTKSVDKAFDHTRINITWPSNDNIGNTSVILFKFPEFEDDNFEKRKWILDMEAYKCIMYLCSQEYTNWTMANGT
ncbi:hypothetical protein PG984_011688 [Apiospora sp. TS-2023a]